MKKGFGRAYIILDLDEPKLIHDVESLQKKMKEALEKMQQQQNTARKEELEKKAKEEFGKYIKNATIDAVSIVKYDGCDFCDAVINLKDDSKNTDIEISEFLNNDFRKKNNIHKIRILNGDQEEVICGFVDKKGVRCYDLGATVQYGIKFNWYVDGKEHSITLGANSDGSIRVVGDIPSDEDLEKNQDVKIKFGDEYLSLADAVKTCKQNNQQNDKASSKLSQPSASEHFRQLIKAKA